MQPTVLPGRPGDSFDCLFREAPPSLVAEATSSGALAGRAAGASLGPTPRDPVINVHGNALGVLVPPPRLGPSPSTGVASDVSRQFAEAGQAPLDALTHFAGQASVELVVKAERCRQAVEVVGPSENLSAMVAERARLFPAIDSWWTVDPPRKYPANEL